MAFEEVKHYLEERGFADRVMQFVVSSETVELAAQTIGTRPENIAKSLTMWMCSSVVKG